MPNNDISTFLLVSFNYEAFKKLSLLEKLVLLYFQMIGKLIPGLLVIEIKPPEVATNGNG